MADNLQVWNQLCHTDPKHTKGFSRPGGFKGTAIRPLSLILKMTEQFGPCGSGWKISEPKFTLVNAEGGEVLVFCEVSVSVKFNGDFSAPVPGVGGDVVVKSRRDGGKFVDDEAYKKAFTDAVGNALKFLGMSADIYLDEFDGSKYRPDDAPPPQNRSDNWTHPNANPTPQNDAQQANAAAPGPITVQFIHGETAEAPDPTEAAKMLARRMRQLDSPLHIQDMMKFNDGWVSKLPETWRSGMMSILADKQKAADEMAQSMGGRAA